MGKPLPRRRKRLQRSQPEMGDGERGVGTTAESIGTGTGGRPCHTAAAQGMAPHQQEATRLFGIDNVGSGQAATASFLCVIP
jgi:hypothetical protein